MASIEQQLIAQEMQNEGVEVLDWSLYDSLLTTASVVNNLTFFQNTIGGVTRSRTNMSNAGSLPSPKRFLITSMELRVFNTDGTPFFSAGGAAPTVYPLNAFIGQSFFDIYLDPTTMYEDHLASMMEYTNYMNDTGATLGVASITPAFIYRTKKFSKPVIIGSNRAFALRQSVVTPAAALGYTAATTLFMWFLRGILVRNK